jgi:hypothetical protein
MAKRLRFAVAVNPAGETTRLVSIILVLTLSGCVVPAITQPLDPAIEFKNVKSVSLIVEDQVNTDYSRETVNLFEGLLRGRLRSFGYEVVDHGADCSLQIFVDEAKQGDKAAMFFIGFGAGRAVLTFTALFRNSAGEIIGRFTGGKSLHGQEIFNSAIYKSHEDMQHEMIRDSVKQIARFIETNGKLE